MEGSANRSRLIAGLAVAAITTVVAAAPVSTPGTPGIKWLMCEEPGNAVKFRQPAGTNDLIISCTTTSVSLTIKGCVGPRVKRVGTNYTVTCERMEQQ